MKWKKFAAALLVCAMVCGYAAGIPEHLQEQTEITAAASSEYSSYQYDAQSGYYAHYTHLGSYPNYYGWRLYGFKRYENGEYVFISSDEMATITSFTIPSFVDGEPVLEIVVDAFSGCSSLASVTIPDSVTTIGGGAFSGCSSLASVTIPDSVTTIGGGAFSGCSSLSSIIIPKGVTEIGERTFIGCSSLKSVAIPNSVTNIGDIAFRGCSSLESVTIPDSVTTIGGGAFYQCSSLESVTIPDSVTNIGGSAFNGCSSLESVTIPDSVTNIGGSAFNGCSSLESVTIPESVKKIGSDAFSSCGSLESVTIPDSVTVIDNAAFSNCAKLATLETLETGNNPNYTAQDNVLYTRDMKKLVCVPAGKNLTTFIVPDSVTEIQAYALYGCNRLKSITIPASVTTIGSRAIGYSSLGNLIADFVIYGEEGSAAETYALENAITFKSAGESPTEPATSGNYQDSGVTGDFDGDRAVTAADAAIILQYAANVGAGFVGTLPEFLTMLNQ